MKTTIQLKLASAVIYFFIIFIFGYSPTLAQKPSGKEANIWYFGHSCGLDFNNSPPSVLLDGKTHNRGGFATVSDSTGSLLFYTTPDTIFNRNHQPIPNTPVLKTRFGHNPSSAIAMPWMGNPGKYFVFSAVPTFQYSIVDMSLNGGLGDVMPAFKQVELLDSTFKIAGLVAVHHQNRRDIWLTGYENGTNKYYTYLISPTGISTSPIINQVGMITNAGWGGNVHGITAFKISPDGRTIAKAVVNPSSLGPSHEWVASTQLLGFDPANAAMTNIGVLPDSTSLALEFSPDGLFLYASGDAYIPLPKQTNYNNLWQYDLTLGTPAAIYANRILVASDPIPRGFGGTGRLYGFMQAAPDGKIYMTMGWTILTAKNNFLSVIHKPNEKGAASQFLPYSIDMNPDSLQPYGRITGLAFPNFVQSYFFRPKIYLQQMCLGDSAFFSINNRGAVDSVKWNFGDPASGAANTSTAFSPSHYYNAAGTYTVNVIAFYQFGSDTLTENIFVPTVINTPQLGPDTVLCPGDTLILNAFQPGNVSYIWQDSISAYATYTVTQPGTYWVDITNGCGTFRDSITVNLATPFTFSLGQDRQICPGDTLTFSAARPNASYLWQDGSKDSSLTVTQPGLYWAEVTVACHTFRDSITVNYRPEPNPKWLPDSLTICKQDFYDINGSHPDAISYRWQDGSTSPTFTAQTSGIYWLEITTTCSTVRDSIQVTINKLPEIRFSDTTICNGDSFRLTAPKALSYRWSTGDTARSITINKAGMYKVELETVPNCFFSDSLEVKTERCFKTAFIPNIVTPNNDNFNDQFEPKGLEAGEYELEVYNRWGSLIYQQKNYKDQWPDKKLSDGTYYYLLRNRQSGKTYKGWVEVVY